MRIIGTLDFLFSGVSIFFFTNTCISLSLFHSTNSNGQRDQIPYLVKRDRNHPSVVIWSICNEVLCNSGSTQDAKDIVNLIHSLDPYSGRPVSANQNGYIGPNTPLDVQGFDYATTDYDQWHKNAPNIPSISSETSSAVSDRGEYKNDAAGGHVSGYDNQYPGWGQSAEQAWGGIGEGGAQGILTRPFISGGWTWTGWDYRVGLHFYTSCITLNMSLTLSIYLYSFPLLIRANQLLMRGLIKIPTSVLWISAALTRTARGGIALGFLQLMNQRLLTLFCIPSHTGTGLKAPRLTFGPSQMPTQSSSSSTASL